MENFELRREGTGGFEVKELRKKRHVRENGKFYIVHGAGTFPPQGG